MKILFIHNRYQQHGGEDVIFDQEVSLLKAAGFDVEVLIFNNESFSKEKGAYKLVAGLKTFYNNESAKIVEMTICTFKPDVVHIHNLFYTASPSIISAVKRLGVPVVMTLHNYRLVCSGVFLMREGEVPCERCVSKTVPLDGIRYKCFRNSRLQSAQLTLVTSLHKVINTWKKVDKYVVLTDFAKTKILQSSLNLSSDQITVKPNSISDLGYVTPSSRKNFILYIGRLSPEKGISTLLDSIRKLPPINIKIIGDGPLRDSVDELSRGFPMVEYLGQQPREVVVEYLKQCKALVVPSVWYEGLPTVILEALSTGTPVLCADNPNLRSIVGDCASFFAAGDEQDLARKISHLYNNEISDLDCVRSRDQYEKRYTHEIVLQEQVDIYSSLVVRARISEHYLPDTV
ncbi:glycosyltransferase [Spirosoma radiotolerans]|uniref:Group 1 glycosyl transferase n=1 Tax=Spirosoma radiotolerans TaxID=1379870 RepID=A0A0E4A266_9BACT|nr:glycosyltransferase [Spirosoma radiotolerans]AKD58702.1 group 1 glycosyl transferase [Spirosoma radiotolerans]